jgi:hypothetical protein
MYRRRIGLLLAGLVLLTVSLAGCGGKSPLLSHGASTRTGSVPPSPSEKTTVTGSSPAGAAQSVAGRTPEQLGFPSIATKNTTRVPGASAVENAAAVALAVFPSAAPGTHPAAVALAPTDDWQAAVAAASLMAPPLRAPLLLSGAGSLPTPTSTALSALAPVGETLPALKGAQVMTVGDAPAPKGLKSVPVSGSDPFALAAGIDALEARARGRESIGVIIASADQPAYAMPAAGLAAESGVPILYVHAGSIPAATAHALRAHHHPHIYVLGPPSVISDSVVGSLGRFGTVKRVGADGPGANSVAFAEYRDPACTYGQACVHVPHSFGWAIRSPGHAYVLINAADPLEAAAAAPLSASGGYGPQLLVEDPNTLPKAVLNYFLNYATPGYTQEGPTAAVYNHAWLIGDRRQITLAVQAQVDSLLEAVPQR